MRGAVVALATVFVYIGVAFIIALAPEPLVKWAGARGIPRWAAVLMLTGVAMLLVAGAAFTVIPAITQQVTRLVADAPTIIADSLRQPWAVWVKDQVGASVDINSIIRQASAFITDPRNLLSIGGGILAVGSGVANDVAAIIVVMILTLYFTLTLPLVMTKVYQAVPRSRRDGYVSITEEILTSVGRHVAGQITRALANATVTFILVTIVGAPVPVLLALIAFIGALIPVVGPVIGSTIVVLACLTTSPVGALIAAVVLLVYMQVEAYLLTPRVMAKAVAVPGALVIVAAERSSAGSSGRWSRSRSSPPASSSSNASFVLDSNCVDLNGFTPETGCLPRYPA